MSVGSFVFKSKENTTFKTFKFQLLLWFWKAIVIPFKIFFELNNMCY